MRILVLGGTVFVGRHLTEAALERGHDVTHFNRGSRPDVLPEVETLVGDRDGDLSALMDGTWDAVIDTSGYLPRIVRDSVRTLRERVPRYAFVSTISVYADSTRPHQDEDAELKTLDDPSVETVTGETYGGLKVLCEREVVAGYPNDHLIVRPGIVVGPHDPTDRFTYWVRRMAGHEEVLAPDAKEQPVQWIDARDLAAWTIRALDGDVTGTFNLVAPADVHDFESLLATCRDVARSRARIVWVNEDHLLENGVRPFADLPLWIHGDGAALFRMDAGRARRQGLATRPLDETVADTLTWDRERGAPELKTGLTRERERALIEGWRAG